MPSTSTRLAVVSAVVLLATTPLAHAASEGSQGALKKQVSELTAAPQAPTESQPAAQAPAAQEKQAVTQGEPKASDKVPVTKGTVKKVVTTTPAGTEGDTGGADDAGEETTAAARRSSRRSTRRTSRTTAGARARARRAGGSAARRRAGGGSASRAERAREAAAATAERKRAARRRPAAAPAMVTAPEVEDRSGLGSITHAADAVVEVIPGTVVLAMAGLAALVLLLVARSYAMERRRSVALASSYEVTVEALATAIEAKDHTTGGHIERVRNLGLLLAREIVPREARDPQMAYGFLLHDIGKLAVPDAILRAPGKLSEEEWTLMRRHPEEGVRMLSHVPFLDRALDVVRHHHERWDGGGYPQGLAGGEIPLWARIFAVVDALDAMTADRPYRDRCSYDAALAELSAHAGTQFDPHVVAALERLDPALVEPLLEPVQVLDREPLAGLPEPAEIKPLVAA